MSVLAPAALVALVALPVIVLLHMRHVTPRVKPFPALRFWQAAEPVRTTTSRFRRPPITLPLILQLLAAAALALALARPVTDRALDALGVDLRTDPRHEIVLLDGSTSMGATAEDGGTRWDAARAAALARLDALSEGDAATVMVLGSRVQTLGATDGASLRSLRDRLATMPAPGGRADLDAAMSLAADLLLPDRENAVTVITDGALAADPAVAAALGAPVELVDLPGPEDNLAVVSVAAKPGPQGGTAVYARVANFGATEAVVPVALVADGLEAGREDVTIPPDGGSVELGWAAPPGTASATVRIDHADALLADDAATLPLAQEDGALGLRILHVSDLPSPLSRVLTALPGATVTGLPGSALEESGSLGRYDLAVLEGVAVSPEALARLDAPLLVVSPAPGGVPPVAGMMADPTVSQVRAGDPLLAGVDLAGVTFGVTPILGPDASQRPVVSAAEGPLVTRMTLGGQPAIVMAFDPTASNLPRRVAFPILVANAVGELAPAPPPASVALGEPLRFEARAGVAEVEIAPPAGDPVRIALPDDGARAEVAFAGTGTAGEYRLAELDPAGNALGAATFVVNAGHPRESDLRPNPDLAAALAQARAGGETAAAGPAGGLAQLWPLLALAALPVLLAEWIASLWPRRRRALAGSVER